MPSQTERLPTAHKVAAFVAACAAGICCVLLVYGIGQTAFGKLPTHTPKGLVTVFSLLVVFCGFLLRDGVRIARAELPIHIPVSNMYLAFGIVTAVAILPSELMYFGPGLEHTEWAVSSMLAVIAGLLLKRKEPLPLKADVSSNG